MPHDDYFLMQVFIRDPILGGIVDYRRIPWAIGGTCKASSTKSSSELISRLRCPIFPIFTRKGMRNNLTSGKKKEGSAADARRRSTRWWVWQRAAYGPSLGCTSLMLSLLPLAVKVGKCGRRPREDSGLDPDLLPWSIHYQCPCGRGCPEADHPDACNERTDFHQLQTGSGFSLVR